MTADSLLDKYERLTTEALAVATKAKKTDAKRAAEILDMASRYVSDAKHFRKNGDEQRALAALSYAHGWLDCGARLSIFVVTDDRLFTVDAPKKKR